MTDARTHIAAPENKPGYSLALKIAAQLFSVVFHPLFIPTYVIAFLLRFHPSYFSGFSDGSKLMLLLTTILNTAFFPAFSVLIMKGLGFISSILLPTRQDRIGPYLAAMIFYFWAARVFFKFVPQLSPELPSFMTGVFITTIFALLANIFFKISMHAIGCGGLIGIFIVVMNSNTMLMTWPLALAILVTGMVCTARFVVSNHTQKEIYSGLLVGLACQLIAALIIL
ncbi:MAG TPA: hypothetical protein PLZ45_02160 [Ferruginibacter sp.]|nr:hypothetical protein [Chitinophagaceae bacterium]HRI23445.1 hypothetical protein [Ferruginibacter sp.]